MLFRHAIKQLCLTTIICWLAPNALGEIHLQLTQGVDSAIPIAMPAFTGDAAPVSGKTTLVSVIKNDLQNSGEFRVIDSGSSDATPADWKKQGANDLLTGHIKKSVLGNYTVTITLDSLYGDHSHKQGVKGHKEQEKGPLLTQQFTVSSPGLRGLAHHISDLIYQQLTGVRGVFSTKIAYILVKNNPGAPRSYALVVADADGFNPQTLLKSPLPIMSPTWLPDGKQIAYVSFEGHRAQVYQQDLATGARQVVSAFPGINGAPAFSHDGQRIALVLTRTGNPKIFVINMQNKKILQITHGYSIDTEPVWSKDDKSLYFTSNRDGGPQVYRYDFAHGEIARMTFNGNYNARPCLTADNKYLVMMHRQMGMFGIAKEDLTSGRTTVLTESGNDESPSLAPNGKMILYGTEFAGRSVLGVVSIDGRIKLRLPSEHGDVQDPAWSPYLS